MFSQCKKKCSVSSTSNLQNGQSLSCPVLSFLWTLVCRPLTSFDSKCNYSIKVLSLEKVSLKKPRRVIFSKGHTKYHTLQQFILYNEKTPFEIFFKYLGVEISDNCRLRLVKTEQRRKQKITFFNKQLLSTKNLETLHEIRYNRS